MTEFAGVSERAALGTADRRSLLEKSPALKLMLSMLRIGAIGFGGGSALIPVIEEEVVTERRLVTQDEYDEDVVAACVTPGALPVEIAAGVGSRVCGVPGMLAASVLMALPGALLTVLALAAVSSGSAAVMTAVRYLSVGLGAFISSLLIVYAVRSVRPAAGQTGRERLRAPVVMLLVFFLTCGRTLGGRTSLPLPALGTVEVLLISFAVIFVTGLWSGTRSMHVKAKPDWTGLGRETSAWTAFVLLLSLPALLTAGRSFDYLIRGLVSSLLSFGGGDAYLSVADGLFAGSGLVRADAFYGTLVPVANLLPGSILCKILSGTGYLVGLEPGGRTDAFLLAAAGFGVSVAASGFIFGLTRWMMRTFRDAPFFRRLGRFIRPIIGGLLLNVMLTMVKTNLETGAAMGKSAGATLLITAAVVGIDLFLLLRKKTGQILPMLFSAAAGAALLILI